MGLGVAVRREGVVGVWAWTTIVSVGIVVACRGANWHASTMAAAVATIKTPCRRLNCICHLAMYEAQGAKLMGVVLVRDG